MSTDPVIAQNIALIRRFLDEVVNAGRYELIDEIWAADLAWHGGSLGEIEGIDAYTQFITGAKDAFRDMHLTVHDVVAAGDKVVVRFTNSGVQTGPFLGSAPTGTAAAWDGIGIYAIRDGRIAEAWFTEDLLALMTQLGIVERPAEVR